jgi:hypothetical protein
MDVTEHLSRPRFAAISGHRPLDRLVFADLKLEETVGSATLRRADHPRPGDAGGRAGSPASEQSAHHAADQTTWTATATIAVMVSTTPATTMGQMVVIGIAAAARVGVRHQDDFGQ